MTQKNNNIKEKNTSCSWYCPAVSPLTPSCLKTMGSAVLLTSQNGADIETWNSKIYYFYELN